MLRSCIFTQVKDLYYSAPAPKEDHQLCFVCFFWHYSNVFHVRWLLWCVLSSSVCCLFTIHYILYTVDILYIVRSSAAIWFAAVHGFGPLLYLCIRTFFTASIQLRVCIIMIRLLFWLPNIKKRAKEKIWLFSRSVFCCCVYRALYTYTAMMTDGDVGRRSWAKMPTVRDDNLL